MATADNYVATANADEIDLVYKARIPKTFSFTKNAVDTLLESPSTPVATGTIGDTEYAVSLAENNKLESFWSKAYPTRVSYSNITKSLVEVLESTYAEDLPSATFTKPATASRLYVTLTGAVTLLDLSRDVVRGQIVVKGYTQSDVLEEERLIFITNCTQTTLKRFKEVTEVRAYGIDPVDSAYVSITNGESLERHMEQFGLYVDTLNNRILNYRLGSQSWGSTLVREALEAGNIMLVNQGYSSYEAIQEIELLSTGGVNVQGIDGALQPFKERFFVVDSTKLYIFDTFTEYPDIRELEKKTIDAGVVIQSDWWHYYRGETISLYTERRNFNKKIIRLRWHVTKPNGTKVAIDPDGTEYAVKGADWILNPFRATVRFGSHKMEYTLAQRGTYIFELETEFEDGSKEIDIKPVLVDSLTAQTEFTLPAALSNPDGVFFDADQRFWIIKGSTAYRLDLHYDIMLIDFERNLALFRESYDSVRISNA